MVEVSTSGWFYSEGGRDIHLDSKAMVEVEAGMHHALGHNTSFTKRMRFGFYEQHPGVYTVKYDITDWNSAVQQNTRTGNNVLLHRYLIDRGTTNQPNLSNGVTWQFEDGHYGSCMWVNIMPEVAMHLEESYKDSNRPQVVSARIGNFVYVFTTSIMRQINAYTNGSRRIQRVAPVVQKPSPLATAPKNPVDFLKHFNIPFVPCESDITQSNDCAICLDSLSNEDDEGIAVRLGNCKGHGYHVGCIKECVDPQGSLECPTCKLQYGCPKGGNQPIDGRMDVSLIPGCLQGHSVQEIIRIDYSFPNGIQGPEHPHPGRRYKGTTRTAYLPNSSQGQEVLRLLRIAWDRRLVFQVGESITLGPGSGTRVCWNGIHHKTSFHGPHGYPDAGYLDRVTDELKQAGCV